MGAKTELDGLSEKAIQAQLAVLHEQCSTVRGSKNKEPYRKEIHQLMAELRHLEGIEKEPGATIVQYIEPGRRSRPRKPTKHGRSKNQA